MLPALRDDLALHAGPATPEGAPTWMLHDPARDQYFSLDWTTFEILARWGLNDPEAIARAVAAETPLDVDEGDVAEVIQFLEGNELMRRSTGRDVAWLVAHAQRRRAGIGRRLLHNYLFFRVPLWRPDRWLTNWLPVARFFFSRAFLALSGAALMLGLFMVSRQWDAFVGTLVDTFSMAGLAGYAVTIVVVKWLHELGHAFSAKRHGCRVPTMGVAFLVLLPMAYTDVNDAWKLRDRRQRLAIGGAGMLVELVIAAWATLAWALLPDGALRGAFFLLATTTWVSTLAINASPFLRFDGYFLLMDWINIPNLHERAFALGRWHLRETLFRLREPPPEVFPKPRQAGIVVFAYLTWFYRLVVFGAIAVLVYQMFPKPLGPFLAAVELWWFILAPMSKEVVEWHRRWAKITASRRTLRTGAVFAVFMLLILAPWDSRVSATALLRPTQTVPVLAHEASRLVELPVSDGERVPAGTILARMASPELVHHRHANDSRAAGVIWEAETVGVDAAMRLQRQSIGARREGVIIEREGLEARRDRLEPDAPFAGRFFHAEPDLKADVWLARNQPVGVLVDTDSWVVEAFLDEHQVQRIANGTRGRFYPDSPGQAIVTVAVIAIDTDASRFLSVPMLATTHGGDILVREQGGRLVPEIARYRVTLRAEADGRIGTAPVVQRGRVVLFGERQSHAAAFTRAVAQTLIRESGF